MNKTFAQEVADTLLNCKVRINTNSHHYHIGVLVKVTSESFILNTTPRHTIVQISNVTGIIGLNNHIEDIIEGIE